MQLPLSSGVWGASPEDPECSGSGCLWSCRACCWSAVPGRLQHCCTSWGMVEHMSLCMLAAEAAAQAAPRAHAAPPRAVLGLSPAGLSASQIGGWPLPWLPALAQCVCLLPRRVSRFQAQASVPERRQGLEGWPGSAGHHICPQAGRVCRPGSMQAANPDLHQPEAGLAWPCAQPRPTSLGPASKVHAALGSDQALWRHSAWSAGCWCSRPSLTPPQARWIRAELQAGLAGWQPQDGHHLDGLAPSPTGACLSPANKIGAVRGHAWELSYSSCLVPTRHAHLCCCKALISGAVQVCIAAVLPDLGLHPGLQLFQLLHPAPMGPSDAPPTLHVLSQASPTMTPERPPCLDTGSGSQSGPYASAARCGGGSARHTSCMPHSSLIQQWGRSGCCDLPILPWPWTRHMMHSVCRHPWHPLQA